MRDVTKRIVWVYFILADLAAVAALALTIHHVVTTARTPERRLAEWRQMFTRCDAEKRSDPCLVEWGPLQGTLWTSMGWDERLPPGVDPLPPCSKTPCVNVECENSGLRCKTGRDGKLDGPWWCDSVAPTAHPSMRLVTKEGGR